MSAIQTGIERLLADTPPLLRGRRLGLLANPASVGGPGGEAAFRSSRDLIADRFPNQLKILLSPQHGFFSEKQANMVESQDLVDPLLKIPVFSLYGETRIPTASMLDPIDVLIVDLQDVGTRVYTYMYTMALCLQAARDHDKQVVVLDRPNPIGGNRVEGNCLKPDCTSFVGMYPIPMRHGLTMGELSLLFNNHFGIGCDLTVIPMTGWNREQRFQETGLPWIAPSPNLPTPVSALVYPGQVLWEGTNVSEGRGTTQPFEVFGAPFLDTSRLQETLSLTSLPGVHLRPLAFEPTSDKWAGRLCRGFQLHVLDPSVYQPYKTTLVLLQAVLANHGDAFKWNPPPYEYEFEKLPFDIITGDRTVRAGLESLEPVEGMAMRWQEELEEYEEIRRPCLLYE